LEMPEILDCSHAGFHVISLDGRRPSSGKTERPAV